MSKKSHVFLLIALFSIFIFSCGIGDIGDLPTPFVTRVIRQRTATPVPANDIDAVRQLINAECEAVVQQDIDRLQSMWASDGRVIDANHTPDNPQDDTNWKNWNAILDRYVNIVFPSNPTFCEHPNIQVQINLPNATATTSTKIGVTNCDNCNRWTLRKNNDGWKITSLTYNLNEK